MPLALGDVRSDRLRVVVERRGGTPNLLAEPDLDAAETSFSRYLRAVAAGNRSLVGIPAFVMTGFRQRCIITTQPSPLRELAQLGGCRIGLTGWADSGNIWTRALLRREGVEIPDVQWLVGPLTAQHPVEDRIGPGGAPTNVAHTPAGRSLVEMLLTGDLDAVMTLFMPPGFHGLNSALRPLLTDFSIREVEYFRSVGFVPGMHLITVRSAMTDRHPWVGSDLLELLRASKSQWVSDRAKLVDAGPWAISEVDRTVKTFGTADWMAYGENESASMVAAFCKEMQEQGILSYAVDPSLVFQEYRRLAGAM